MNRPQLDAGQEWVWDYPRPPRLERAKQPVRVIFDDIEIASTSNAYRILETSHPPVYYVPAIDVRFEYLRRVDDTTFCEWKGVASYYDVVTVRRRSVQAAWTYYHPNASFRELTDAIAFYPGRVDACYVGNERVRAQEGDFYGGWITAEIVGPFKGAPGTAFW